MTTTTTTTMTDTSATMPHVVPEDALLFGSLNTTLHTELGDRLQGIFRQEITALPLLTEVQQQTLLQKAILPHYWRALDIAEVYTNRNVFSVVMYPPTRRQQIVDGFQNGVPQQQQQEQVNPQAGAIDSSPLSNSITPPATSNIPTKTQLHALEQEMQGLRQRLLQAQRARAEAQQALAQTHAAAQVLQNTNIENKPNSILHDASPTQKSIQTLLHNVQKLSQVQAQGQQCIQTLTTKVQSMPQEEKDDMAHAALTQQQPKGQTRKPQSIWEQFAMDQQALAGTSSSQLTKLRQQLQGKHS